MGAVFGLARGVVRGFIRTIVGLLNILVRILPSVVVLAVIFSSVILSLIGDVFSSNNSSSSAPRATTNPSLAAYMEWVRFDVDITVNEDGTIDVVEKPTIKFKNNRSFRNGYREIPDNRLVKINEWAIRDGEGVAFKRVRSGSEPGTYKVNPDEDGYTLNWYFEPTKNETRSFALSYTVDGALRYYEGGDQIWWKAIYPGHEGPIRAGTIRVMVPEGADIHGIAAYIGEDLAGVAATARVAEDERSVIYELQQDLKSGEDFEVRVEFTPGIVAGTAAPWQAADDAEVAAEEAAAARVSTQRLVTIVIALLIVAGGAAGLYLLWYRAGRDKPSAIVIDYLPEPPDALPPGMAGTLLDERADAEDILATVVDLAQRNALRIRENLHGSLVFDRGMTDIDLRTYEEELLKGLFGPDLDRKSIQSRDLGPEFQKWSSTIQNGIYDAVVAEGYFSENPDTVRDNYWYLGVAGVLIAMVVNIGLWIWTGSLLFASLPSMALVIVSIGMVLLSKFMPCKTQAGVEAAARWQAFKTYLADLGNYADVDQYKEIWDRWLPYAIAFGIEKQYVDTFRAVDAPVPVWYGPASGWGSGSEPRYSDIPVPRARGATTSGGGLPSASSSGNGGSGGIGSIGGGGGSRMTLGRMSSDFGSGLSSFSGSMGQSLAVASHGLSFSTLGPDLASGFGDGLKVAFYMVKVVGVFSGGGGKGGRGGGGGSGGFK